MREYWVMVVFTLKYKIEEKVIFSHAETDYISVNI